jgi:hypothetical protein
MGKSAVYADPEIQRLKVCVMAKDEHSKNVTWIEREICELRAQRIARSQDWHAGDPARLEKRRQQRRTAKATKRVTP